MKVKILKEWFAPKLKFITKKIHAIYFFDCNFRCGYCSQSRRNEVLSYSIMNLEQFRSEINCMVNSSEYFKVTGGEPTLMPRIFEVLSIIRDAGGKAFLDSNGSNCLIIKKLIDKKLIYVLGISIKGFTKEECLINSGVSNSHLCWENVFNSCNYAYGKVPVILTCVVHSNTSIEEFRGFLNLIAHRKLNIDYFKINNLYGNDLPNKSIKPINKEKLMEYTKIVLEVCPTLKGKIIVIPDLAAVKNQNSILFF